MAGLLAQLLSLTQCSIVSIEFYSCNKSYHTKLKQQLLLLYLNLISFQLYSAVFFFVRGITFLVSEEWVGRGKELQDSSIIVHHLFIFCKEVLLKEFIQCHILCKIVFLQGDNRLWEWNESSGKMLLRLRERLNECFIC